MPRLLLLLPMMAVLSGCNGFIDYKTQASPIDQEIYTTLGAKQCQADHPLQFQQRIAALKNQLNQVGIVVKTTATGYDGKMYIQQCGAPDGRVVIFRIAANHTAKAQRLGYVVVSDMVRKATF